MKPKVSVVMPTLNAGKFIEASLKSIRGQNYPQDQIEIVVADANSKDETSLIAKKYNCVVVENKLITSEGGKAAGLAVSSGKYIALIDSDNILVDPDWFSKMIDPLEQHPEALGSEPWEYTWRQQDGYITRYCALIGMNDPLCQFIGNYDRKNLITGKWTEIPHEEQDMGDYLLVTFDKRGIPTIGANGCIFRKEVLVNSQRKGYLFDVDVLSSEIEHKGSVKFIKVKTGIVHTYCESSILKFAKKQRRRVMDFTFHQASGNRKYDWFKNGKKGITKFIIYCLTFIPLLADTLKGYLRKPDPAWFFHPVACYVTLWEYAKGTIVSFFIKSEANRKGWKQ